MSEQIPAIIRQVDFDAVAQWAEGEPQGGGEKRALCVLWDGNRQKIELPSGGAVDLLTTIAVLYPTALDGLKPFEGAVRVTLRIEDREANPEETEFLKERKAAAAKASQTKS